MITIRHRQTNAVLFECEAQTISEASTGRSAHFFASNEAALADIRRRAEMDVDAPKATP